MWRRTCDTGHLGDTLTRHMWTRTHGCAVYGSRWIYMQRHAERPKTPAHRPWTDKRVATWVRVHRKAAQVHVGTWTCTCGHQTQTEGRVTWRRKTQSVDHVGVNWDTQTHSCGQRTDRHIHRQLETDRERDSQRLGQSGLATIPIIVIRYG